MKMLLANCLAGIAGIVAAWWLAPKIVAFWMMTFAEPSAGVIISLMTALVVVPGVVGGTAVAVGQWLIGEFRKDGKGQ